MTVIAIILAGSAPLQFSSPRDLVVNMRQPHFARVRARRNCATNAGRELKSRETDTMDYIMHVKYSTFHRHCFDSFDHHAPARSTGILTCREA